MLGNDGGMQVAQGRYLEGPSQKLLTSYNALTSLGAVLGCKPDTISTFLPALSSVLEMPVLLGTVEIWGYQALITVIPGLGLCVKHFIVFLKVMAET